MKAKLQFTLFFIFSSFLVTNLLAFSPPANDACVDAIELTDLENCNTAHVNVNEATANSLSGSSVPNNIDVWYKFTATTNQVRLHDIELDFYNTSSIGFEIYEATCPSTMSPLVYITTYHNHQEFISNLTIGEVYYVRVWLQGGTEADFCIEASCALEVISTTTSACDPIDNTYDLEVEIAYLGGTSGDNITFHIDDFQGELVFNSVDDTLLFTLNDLPASGTSTYAFLNIYNSLDRYCTIDYQNLYTEPAPCIPPPANDSCHQATLISDLTTCNQIHVDVNGATVDSLHGRCDEEVGIWYKFTAISNSIEIDVLDISSYGTDWLQFDLYEDLCSADAILLDCKTIYGESSKNVNNLIIGQEYFLRVFLFRGIEADFCVKAACELEIISTQSLACDPSDNTYDLEIEIGTKNVSVGDSLVLNLDGGPNPTILKYELTASIDTTIFTFPNLASDNQTHYLFVQTQGESFCEDNTNFVAPSSCVPTPDNDSCHQAIILDLMNCTDVMVDMTGATVESDLINSCIGTVDVWYKFTAISASLYLNLNELQAGAELGYQLYEETCSPINQFGNGGCSSYNNAPRFSFINNFTIGEEYFLRITMVNGTTASLCLQALCAVEIMDYTIAPCDNSDNLYDLALEVSGEALPIGEPFTVNVAGKTFQETITSANQVFNINFTDLIADGLPVSIPIHAGFYGCNEYYPDFYVAPAPCVPGPVNDSCHQAINITEFINCDPIRINTTGATASPKEITCSNGTDVWYKFTATSTRYELIGVDLASYGTDWIRFEIFASDCTTAPSELVYCSSVCNSCSRDFDGLVVGNEYFIRLSLSDGIEADFCLKELCDFEIISISTTSCNPLDNSYNLTLEVSISDVEVGDEILFSSTEKQETFTINSIANSYTFQINGLTATETAVSFDLQKEASNEYFYAAFVAPPFCGMPPSNDACTNATEITDLKNCSAVHVDVLGASSEGINIGCQENAIDVWYKFTANVTEIELKNLDFSSYGSTLLIFEFFQGTCSNLNAITECTYIYAGGDFIFTLDNLVIGQAYYFRFWKPGGNSFAGDFCIEALNGNICNDESLNLDMDVANQATYQTEHTITAEGMIPTAENTSFIAEESITLMPGFHAQAGRSSMPISKHVRHQVHSKKHLWKLEQRQKLRLLHR